MNIIFDTATKVNQVKSEIGGGAILAPVDAGILNNAETLQPGMAVGCSSPSAPPVEPG
jgi:hypothetical protein